MDPFNIEKDDFLLSLSDDEIEKIPDINREMLRFMLAIKVPILTILFSLCCLVAFVAFVKLVLLDA